MGKLGVRWWAAHPYMSRCQLPNQCFERSQGRAFVEPWMGSS
jgi:hypothetical protein